LFRTIEDDDEWAASRLLELRPVWLEHLEEPGLIDRDRIEDLQGSICPFVAPEK
jgi:hypothetical protein